MSILTTHPNHKNKQGNILRPQRQDTLILPPPPQATQIFEAEASLFIGAVIDLVVAKMGELGALLKRNESKESEEATQIQFIWLSQGLGEICPEDNNKIYFVNNSLKSKHKKSTYCRVVVIVRPHNKQTKRIILTIGGYRTTYDGDSATPTAYLTTVKLYINSTISIKGESYATSGITDSTQEQCWQNMCI